MQATVPLKALRAAVKAASKAVGRNVKIPMLARLLLTATDTTLTVRGTDLAVDLTVRVDATNATPGAALISAKQLAAVLENAPGDAITISAPEGDKVLLAHARGIFTLEGWPVTDYPPALAEATTTATLPTAAFAKALAKVTPCLSKDQTRYVLNGVLVELGDNRCALVATDGRRMSRQSFGLADAPTATCIIPDRALKLLGVVCRGGNMLALTIPVMPQNVKGARLTFTNGTETLSVRAVEGTYPGYKQVIPAAFASGATFDRRDLLAGVRCIAGALEKGNRAHSLKIAINQAGATITTAGTLPGMGGEYRLPVEYTGSPIVLRLGAGYMTDALRVMDNDRVTINFNAENKPVSLADADTGWTYILMPMLG